MKINRDAVAGFVVAGLAVALLWFLFRGHSDNTRQMRERCEARGGVLVFRSGSGKGFSSAERFKCLPVERLAKTIPLD